MTTSTVDGSIYCQVERAANAKVDDIEFDMTRQEFYILLASGSELRDNSIGFHDLVFAPTKYATLFVEGEGNIFESQSNLLLFLHALFMVFAWLLFASIGITTAKFGKKPLQGYKMCGKDLWFVIHQSCMCTVWLLVISAVTIIWIDAGTWKTSAHSVVGIISAVLCAIHPIAATMRPPPTHERRPVFNFLHGTIGEFAQLLAGMMNKLLVDESTKFQKIIFDHFCVILVIAIFIATTSARANLQDWFKFVLISYVVVYLSSHTVLKVSFFYNVSILYLIRYSSKV